MSLISTIRKVVFALTLVALGQGIAYPQFLASPIGDSVDALPPQLKQTITLDLRDATLLEALFAIRDLTGLNLVVGNEVVGTVNASFANTQVDRILDTLLIPQGYSYRVVSGSIVIQAIGMLGDKLPSFETAVVESKSIQASELLQIVESLLSPEGRAHVVPSSNSLFILDNAARVSDIRQEIHALELAAQAHATADRANLGTTVASADPTLAAFSENDAVVVRVFSPQYVKTTILAEGLTPLLSEIGRVSAMELDNKLIVSDLPVNLSRIEQALVQMDLPRPQVRVWALIYDVDIQDLEACGINFSSSINGSGLTSAGGPSHSATIDAITAPVVAGTNGVFSLSTINRLGSMGTIIQALETSDDSRLLADPNVVVMNHEDAQIAIVTEVPYQRLTQGIEGGSIGTTDFREAGVTLLVTPHIANDQTIAMDINPQFSLLTGFTEGDNAPIIDRRETKTTVRIGNLQTLVLGGLRQRTRTSEKSGIPGLSKIPYMGSLFRFRRWTTRESELLVFITPELLTPDCVGTEREVMLGESQKIEIESIPTVPRGFGTQVLKAEKQAEKDFINSQPIFQRQSPVQVREIHNHGMGE